MAARGPHVKSSVFFSGLALQATDSVKAQGLLKPRFFPGFLLQLLAGLKARIFRFKQWASLRFEFIRRS